MTINMTGTTPDGFHLGGGGGNAIGGIGSITLAPGNRFYWSGGGIGITEPGGDLPDGTVMNLGQAHVTGGVVEGGSTTFTNEAGATATQTGGTVQLLFAGERILNRGTWHFFLPPGGNAVMHGSGTFLNDLGGMFVVEPVSGTGFVLVHSLLHNLGTVHVKAGGTLTLNLAPVGSSRGVLPPGIWIVDPGGLAGGWLVSVIGAGASLTGNGASCPDMDISENHGELLCNDDWNLETDFWNTGEVGVLNGTLSSHDYLDEGGSLNVADGAEGDSNGPCTLDGGEIAVAGSLNCSALDNSGGLVAGHGGSITCAQVNNGPINAQTVLAYANDTVVAGIAGGGPAGFICNAFNNNAGGVIRPGGPDAAGPFRITGNLHQGGQAFIEVELAGLTPVTEHDQVIVTGDIVLDGTLRVSGPPRLHA